MWVLSEATAPPCAHFWDSGEYIRYTQIWSLSNLSLKSITAHESRHNANWGSPMYADDLAVVAGSPAELRALLNIVAAYDRMCVQPQCKLLISMISRIFSLNQLNHLPEIFNRERSEYT